MDPKKLKEYEFLWKTTQFPSFKNLSTPVFVSDSMASAPTAVKDPGLLGVALIIRSKDGPRFVFHYPPRPSTKASKREKLYGTELDESDSEDDNARGDGGDDSDLEEIFKGKGIGKLDLNDKSDKKHDHVEVPENDDHYDDKYGVQVVPWETVLGWSTADLRSILTPARGYHKKRFEMTLDPLHFITYPIHIREDGTWKKKKPKKAKKESTAADRNNNVEGSAAEDKHTGVDDDAEDDGGMTMFNVVFILDLPKHEADARIAEIYHHVIKSFHKALNHAQASSNYVWKESEMILGMREKAREERRPMSWLWSEILLRSTLAIAIRDVYIAISNNKIATIHLKTTPPLDLALQIPVPSFLTRLPGPTEPAMPGLLVTTANPLVADEGNEDQETLNKHFALLLLDDENKIIADIQAEDTEISAPLIECIRLCKPTLSFLQVAQSNSIELTSLLILAQHLIHYRRAIALPPLHSREMYIVSPNCDSRKLPVASVAWKKAFPLAPSLPSFLAMLSAAPRPYKSFAPSKNHRPTYLDMLAWLIRGGWVTQLRTFAWILVWPEIIYEVDYQLKADAIEKAKKGTKSNSGSSESPESTDESGPDKHSDNDHIQTLTAEQVAENARLGRLADKAAKQAAEEAAAFAQMPVPVATDHISRNNAEHLKTIPPYIIKDPHKVSHEESLYIAAIGKRITDQKAKDCWQKFVKYFNGNEALEMIALRENMKRKETWGILMQYQEHILVCKHW
ncbi:related to RMD11 Protein required for sporulation and Meiotic nuclear Division [Phialocephala subalpina]|uniref:Nitrogen permease regulator 3 n=1 Tax=Phialocephala subalpina TaxID=576137 RepID=A0A1L7X718_9HELO|nr:related to RMD11 Protein required for sporulation and Meiotic nuclear Division [Phialocephala subalpina]